MLQFESDTHAHAHTHTHMHISIQGLEEKGHKYAGYVTHVYRCEAVQ